MNTEQTPTKQRVLGVATSTPKAQVAENAAQPDTASLSSSSLNDSSLANETSIDMMCPICGEHMITLAQLNRHLDDEHSVVETIAEDDLKSWFRKKVISKANEVINPNKKFLKLDLFDNNFSFTESSSSVNLQEGDTSAEIPHVQLPRTHWKKPNANELCNLDGCSKYLGVKNGQVNCRKCGRLFCNQHTYYRVRINPQLEYDPEGVWCRCCEGCFLAKPGLNDTTGKVEDLTTQFARRRKEITDKKNLDVLMLERRWTKFYDYYRDGSTKIPLKKFERTVANWQADGEVRNCRICEQKFVFAVLRKHHCRLCGLVVCGDVTTGCSMDVPINLLAQLLEIPSSVNISASATRKFEPIPEDPVIRMCLTCKNSLLSKRLFVRDLLARPPEIITMYESMGIYKQKILQLLPELKATLNEINSTDVAVQGSHSETIRQFEHEHELVQLATKQRVKLMGLFSKIDQITKRIGAQVQLAEESALGTPGYSPDEVRLQKSIYQMSVLFLQENMLSLQSVPKIVKSSQAEPQRKTKREVRELREQLMVLKEQRFLVAEMVETSKRKRSLEDLRSLQDSLRDLDLAISEIDDKLGDESFA